MQAGVVGVGAFSREALQNCRCAGTIDYGLLDYWDVPANELTYNPRQLVVYRLSTQNMKLFKECINRLAVRGADWFFSKSYLRSFKTGLFIQHHPVHRKARHVRVIQQK